MGNNNSTVSEENRISSGIEHRAISIEDCIHFVYEHLAGWKNDPDRLPKDAEDKLSHQLVEFLNNEAIKESQFVIFYNQEPQKGKRTIDISVKPQDGTIVGCPHWSISNRLSHR